MTLGYVNIYFLRQKTRQHEKEKFQSSDFMGSLSKKNLEKTLLRCLLVLHLSSSPFQSVENEADMQSRTGRLLSYRIRVLSKSERGGKTKEETRRASARWVDSARL